MNVSELQERILELSHDEATPDTDMRSKALVWLNHAYREIMDELQPYLPEALMQEQTLATDSAGQVTLNFDVQRMVRVVDTSHHKVLEQQRLAEVLDKAPLLSEQAAPQGYWLQGNVLQVYPKAAVTLTVRYLPVLEDLVTDGTAESILLPLQFHHVLVWGGLVWGSLYERAFSAKSDLVLFQEKWEEAKRRVKLSLMARPDGPLRTVALED